MGIIHWKSHHGIEYKIFGARKKWELAAKEGNGNVKIISRTSLIYTNIFA